jgi:hypothetical protein
VQPLGMTTIVAMIGVGAMRGGMMMMVAIILITIVGVSAAVMATAGGPAEQLMPPIPSIGAQRSRGCMSTAVVGGGPPP